MPPNSVQVSIPIDTNIAITNGDKPIKGSTASQKDLYYKLKLFQSSLVLIGNILIGAVVGVAVIFAVRGGVPLGPTPMHIVLCVIGYQLLMAHAIMTLSSEGGWAAKLSLVHKRRAHWILQIAGSGLAIGGSIHKMLDKNVNFDTLHGRFGLAAFVFTGLSLLNGFTSLYAYELRKCMPGNLSKITHICFGIVAFLCACTCLIHGFQKNMFSNWATQPVADTMIWLTIFMIITVLLTPLLSFYNKTKGLFKR